MKQPKDKEERNLENIHRNLKRILNLNNYETKIMVALLIKKRATIYDLHKISNVPRSRTYDVLETLEKKGFITLVQLSKPLTYVILSPNELIEKIIENINSLNNKSIEKLKEFKKSNEFKEIEDLYKNNIPKKEDEEIISEFLFILNKEVSKYIKFTKSKKDNKYRVFKRIKECLDEYNGGLLE